jgi:hypothetical protein
VELSSVLKKVNALIAKAEHEATPPEEAQACRETADRLMTKYAIEEAELDAARPAAERMKPDKMSFPVGEYTDIVGHVAGLMTTIARHCRCLVKHYTSSQREADSYVYYSTIYGYSSDLKFFEILWTSVRLHMLGVLVPGIRKDETEEENAYRLHEAGYNWLEIAGLYGWRKVNYSDRIHREHERGFISDELHEKWQLSKAEIWYSEAEDAYKTNWQLGSKVKRAYHNACKAKGEKPHSISANGSKTYRKSAARGYHAMIEQRLRQMRREHTGTGTALVLRSDELRDYFREENPSGYARCPRCGKMSANIYECEFCGQFIKDRPSECEACKAAKSGHCRAHPKGSSYRTMPVDYHAYSAGSEHAKSADLNVGARVDAPTPKSIS